MSRPLQRRIVDLSFPIHEGMTTFPVHWHPVVEVTQLGRHGIENRETRRLVLGTHTGTHCDAPSHFIPGGATIDTVSLETLIGPAVVLDLSDARSSESIGVNALEKRLKGRKPERLVLRYDWSDKWGTLDYYASHPFLSLAAAQWIAKSGVRLLAMDTPMPDDPVNGQGHDPDSPNHKVLLGDGVILVEYLNNLRALRSDEIELVVLPLNVIGADGAPARCVAIEEA